MKLQSNMKLVRWFSFVQNIIGSNWEYRNGTNLCHFVRVCFLWGTGVVAVIATMFSALFAILFIAPFYGLWAGPVAVLMVLLGGAAAYGVWHLYGRLQGKIAPEGSMAYCAVKYAQAIKGKFCPLIEFKEE